MTGRLAIVLLVTSSLAACTMKGKGKPAEPSLYERLGGTYPIAAVCDDFLNQVAANDTLNANPDIKAALDKFKVPKAEQEELLKIVGSTHDDIVTKP